MHSTGLDLFTSVASFDRLCSASVRSEDLQRPFLVAHGVESHTSQQVARNQRVGQSLGCRVILCSAMGGMYGPERVQLGKVDV